MDVPKMLLPVLKHVEQSRACFTGRAELAGVVAIGPDWPFPTQSTVHGQRDTDGQPADSLQESTTVVAFYDRVQVICLDGERDNPESRVGGPTNRRQNLLEDSFVSQGRKPAVCSQRHVNRIAALVLPPAPMRNRWSTPHDRRSPGPLTNTSSRTWEEQVELTRTQTHFEKGDSLSAGSPGGCAGARVAPVGLGTDSERANARARASESPRSPGGRPRGPRPSSPTCR